LQIGELLTQDVALCRNATDYAMGRFQLLHQHVEVPVQSSQRGVIVRAFQRRCRRFLLAFRAPGGAGPATPFLA
jgi:hypothetical protein